ncbi:MAG: Spo0E family sporulation regulatory protein-aspartic acid phosphatase [Clostridia bacterium]
MNLEIMDKLKRKLEDQILKKDSYDKIYETSVEIDKMIIEYYKTYGLTKKT